MVGVKGKSGRKPLGKKAMTAAENKRRQRKVGKILSDQMQAAGYKPVTVYMSPEHIEAIYLINAATTQEKPDGIDMSSLISEWIWQALNEYFGRYREKSDSNDEAITMLHKLVNSEDWPVCSNHVTASVLARMEIANFTKSMVGDKDNG